MIIRKVKRFFKNPCLLLYRLDEKRIITLSDEKFLKYRFRIQMGRELDLNDPKSFNEKLQWLKLNDRNPLYTTLVDKYEVKKYVTDLIGKEYIIPTLGVYDKFDEIDFSKLPKQFVIKCTHDSGGIVIVKDKSNFDIVSAKKIINKSLKRNYFYGGREYPYYNVKPRIIVEKYMATEDQKELIDYKFMCFNGKVKCSFVCNERYSNEGLKVTFFDLDWNKLPFERHYPSSNKNIEKPKNYNLMIKLAEKLAKDITFVRVDFYEIDGKVYFGELTFFPGAGFEEFTPEEWDIKLGNMLKLPKYKLEEKNEK